MKPQYHVVSFSGGKDSTAMLLHMLELGMQVDEIIFCDTYMEFPEMIEHVNKVEKYIGRPITRLRAEHSFEWHMFEQPHLKHPEMKGRLYPGPNNRWCTFYMKTYVIDKHLRELRKEFDLVQYIGIAADEQRRVREKNYPLVEWGWTEKDCLEYCYDRGFTWGGLYEIFSRVSCWCCPLQSLPKIKALHDNFPQLWEKLREYERRGSGVLYRGRPRTWFPRHSIPELEQRFKLEDEWNANGWEVNTNSAEWRRSLAIATGKGGQVSMFDNEEDIHGKID